MNYDKWLSGKDIPTVRRLDYIVEGTDNVESGFLYSALRKMSYLKDFKDENLSEKIKEAEFNEYKIVLQDKLNWVNDWMSAHQRDKIFTDINDWKSIGDDYDYFWELRTEEQFQEEEAKARLGKSKRKPIDHECGKHEQKIVEIIKKMKKTLGVPSLD